MCVVWPAKVEGAAKKTAMMGAAMGPISGKTTASPHHCAQLHGNTSARVVVSAGTWLGAGLGAAQLEPDWANGGSRVNDLEGVTTG